MTTDRTNVTGEHKIEFHRFAHIVAGRWIHDSILCAELTKLGPSVFIKLVKLRQSWQDHPKVCGYPVQGSLIFGFDGVIERCLLLLLFFASVRRGSVRIASNSITF